MGTSEILTSLTMANHRTGEKQKTQITKYAGAFFLVFLERAPLAPFFFLFDRASRHLGTVPGYQYTRCILLTGGRGVDL